jgi:C-terminal processing protease CtpA/Prc
VFEDIGPAQSIEETYGGITLALTMLGDNHSIYASANGQFFRGRSSLNCDLFFRNPLNGVPDFIGYVKVSRFVGTEGSEEFAAEIQNQIKSQDNENTLGWIVDLRGNTGGNMWPMLAGIGPLLGNQTVGYFINDDGEEISYGYSNGASVFGGSPLVEVNDHHVSQNQNSRVAVLLDNAVASSGEAIAIAFVGRENTRSFGSATCGLSTANAGFPLSDGASLNLTISYMADRHKNKYGIPIEPDVQVVGDTEILQAAIGFLTQ